MLLFSTQNPKQGTHYMRAFVRKTELLGPGVVRFEVLVHTSMDSVHQHRLRVPDKVILYFRS